MNRVRVFMERWQMAIVYAVLVMVVVGAFAADDENDDQRFRDLAHITHDLRVSEINSDYHICTDTRTERETFAEFLDQSARPSSAGVNFAALSTFADLDPAMKAFLAELASVQSGGTSTVQEIADRYREEFFPLTDCEQVRDDALVKAQG